MTRFRSNPNRIRRNRRRNRTRRIFTLATLCAAFLLLLAPGLADAQNMPAQDDAMEQRNLGDADVERAIENELFLQTGVSFHGIDVEVSDGIATLSGNVSDLLSKHRAERVAELTRGVRSVVNTIEVRPSGRTDAEIHADVEAALLADPATDSYEVETTVVNGEVTLTGEVDSWQERELAGTVAKNVQGVTGLDNRISVTFDGDRPDYEIQAEIERRLTWDVRVDDGLIDVSVDGSEVTLDGVVGSAAEKRHAATLAWVGGVVAVDDSGLEVESWARDERLRQDKYAQKSDEEIGQAIRDAFLYDPRVLSFNPEVDVRGGTVTLTGVVDNLQAKRAAAQDARNTVGVFRVKNLLKVRPVETPSDEQIAQELQQSLVRDPHTESYEITVLVNDGEANLYGTVDSFFEKTRATDVAAGVEGVLAVDNNLEVEPDTEYAYEYTPYSWEVVTTNAGTVDPIEDWEILDDVNDQLFWSPFVDSDEVTVTVSDGVATLTGTVDTWSERRAAEENAYEGGALSVVNELEVDLDYGPNAMR